MKRATVAVSALLAMLAGSSVFDAAMAHPPLPAGCSASTRAGCVYTPAQTFVQTGIFDTVLTDAARNGYQLPVRVRYPVGAAGPLPVVIYNHGGGASANSGFKTNSQAWPEAWARHGYVVINPSRAPIPAPTNAQLAECALNSIPPIACGGFFGYALYGPANTDFLISRFAQLASLHPPLSGLMDSGRVVVAGWSGGSTIALGNAGAARQFDPSGPVYDQKTDQPIAFFGIATMGPDYAGFDGGFSSESYDLIDERPFITFTGKGDTNGKPSEARTTAWRRSAAGNKFISYDTVLTVTHGTVNISECNTAIRVVHCEWMKSAGLAFLDAVTQNRAAAKLWLASDAYETLTSGKIEFHRR